MKRFFLWLILASFLVSFCGCDQPTTEEFEVSNSMPSISQKPSQEETLSENTLVFESVENDSRSTIYFYDQDISHLSFRAPTTYVSDRADPPSTYSEIMKMLHQDNGIIVAGYAYGLREGYLADGRVPKTLTQFKVEKVYFGNLNQDTIVISEDYYLVSNEKEEYIEREFTYTLLKDNRKTLLFLVPANRPNEYWPIYYETPLPDDYQEFTDADRKELFDYYRGDLSVFNMELAQPKEAYTETVNNPDGSISIIQFDAFDNFWPVRDVSDEVIIAENEESILMRMIVDYNIKIWPRHHIRYSAGELKGPNGAKIISLPY